MANNQDTQTEGNLSGEASADEQQTAETASAAGTVPTAATDQTAQPESGWDTAGSGTGQPADVGSTAESSIESSAPAGGSSAGTPSGAQLSPNAPRTVKKPADMKPPQAATTP